MKQLPSKYLISLVVLWVCFCNNMNAQNDINISKQLSSKEKSIIIISSLTAKGDLAKLKPALQNGLNAGLTINEIKEVLVHLYAYCGFPRSIRGLQTFMEVLEERRSTGKLDLTGRGIYPINHHENKYARGKKILDELLKKPQPPAASGYAFFAPIIDTFLKEHLFADIFERNVLTYAERELVTVSVLSAIGNAEPMLKSHYAICLNVGITSSQLNEFLRVIKHFIGKSETRKAKKILHDLMFSAASSK